MIDLLMQDGDLVLEKDDIDDDGVIYDLALMDRTTSLTRLLRRAIETPITYIGRHVIDSEGIRKLDLSYGNGVYLELSEPFNISWIQRAETHIKKALSFLPSSITILSLNISPTGLFSARIDIKYQIDDIVTSLSSDINLEQI